MSKFLAKYIHIECTEYDSEELIRSISRWIKVGKAAKWFGTYIKLVEELRPNTPVQQIDRIIRMNRHGRRFQASVDMIKLSGLMNSYEKILPEDDMTTVREQLISRTTTERETTFLAVTKIMGLLLLASYLHQISQRISTRLCMLSSGIAIPWIWRARTETTF